jgi:hypothetical protein
VPSWLTGPAGVLVTIAVAMAVAAAAAVAFTLQITEALAVYAAVHTSIAGLRAVLDDRIDLDVSVRLEPPTLKVPDRVVAKVVNRGRREAVIEAVGFAQANARIASLQTYRHWREDRGRKYGAELLQIKLQHNEVVELTTPAIRVVGLGGEYARWLYVRHSRDVVWRQMPAEYFATVPHWDKVSRDQQVLRSKVAGEKGGEV